MLAALRALPLLWRIAGAAGIVLAIGGGLWGVYAHVRGEGYRDGRAAAEAECEAAQRRQQLANQNAIDAANRRLLDLADQLTLKELQVDDYVKAIDLATARDPRGTEQCLDPDGVRRLNTVR